MDSNFQADHENNSTIFIASKFATAKKPIRVIGNCEDYNCPVCRELYTWPELTPCGHIIDTQCLEVYVSNYGGEGCPVCRKPLPWTVPNVKIEREVKELKIHCINENEGCAHICSISDMEDHIKECGLGLVECEYEYLGCEAKLTREQLVSHIAETDHFNLLTRHCLELSSSIAEMKLTNSVMTSQLSSQIQSQKPCGSFHGKTSPEDWNNYYSDELKCAGVYVKVDLTSHQLENVPTIVTSLHGATNHWTLTGGSSPYSISEKEFTIYIPHITVSDALRYQYCIHYIGYTD
jgi:hypothetical protein